MSNQNETIRLLKECDAGVQMGIDSLEEVIGDLEQGNIRKILQKSKQQHEEIKNKITEYLNVYKEEGKEPSAIAETMASMKEHMKMMMKDTKCAAADVIIDGCHMGIKSIYRYLNQYPNAEQKVKQLVYDIVEVEEQLSRDLRCYL